MTEESESNVGDIAPSGTPIPFYEDISPLDGLNDEEILEKYKIMYELEHKEGRKQELNKIISNLQQKINNTHT